MKRKNFLQAATLLPFLTNSLFAESKGGIKSLNKNTEHSETSGADQRDFFYRPAGAWAADFIPLYSGGKFQLFYLLDWRDIDKHGEGTPWYRISTNDFVNFTEHGEVLPRGSNEQQDLYVFTGSAISVGDQYHIFYTGHNPHLRKQGKPEQGVMHAVSDDMIKWKKIPEQTFYAPADKYEKDDWRDPFVFWNDEDKEYNMLLAARFKKGIPRRRGLTALCTSKDLTSWEVKEPFYAPDLYFTHECPDLFKMGDWWYLLFSEFTDLVRTRYRMSRSLKGPWLTPGRDDFDGHAFYAAKTASDGKRRFIFGWNPTRSGSKDTGTWNWGGNLVVHEVIQQSNGELAVKVPDSVSSAFTSPVASTFTNGMGNYSFHNGIVTIKAPRTFGAALGGKMPGTCRINTTVTFEKGTREFGLMLRSDDNLDKAYFLTFHPLNKKLVFDMWPRDRSEVSHLVELDRDISLIADTPVKIQVFIDGTKGVAYVDDIVAMNFRAYDLTDGNWGFFVSDGTAVFSNFSIYTF